MRVVKVQSAFGVRERSEEKGTRIEILQDKAIFGEEGAPRWLRLMKDQATRAMRREFANAGGGGEAPHAVRLILVILQYQGTILRGHLFVVDEETGWTLARYADIKDLNRWKGGRATRLQLSNQFAKRAFRRFNSQSDLTGRVRSVEEMAAAYLRRRNRVSQRKNRQPPK